MRVREMGREKERDMGLAFRLPTLRTVFRLYSAHNFRRSLCSQELSGTAYKNIKRRSSDLLSIVTASGNTSASDRHHMRFIIQYLHAERLFVSSTGKPWPSLRAAAFAIPFLLIRKNIFESQFSYEYFTRPSALCSVPR